MADMRITIVDVILGFKNRPKSSGKNLAYNTTKVAKKTSSKFSSPNSKYSYMIMDPSDY